MKNPKGRMPSPKPGQIRVAWATERGDKPTIHFCYKGEPSIKRDSNMIMSHFGITPTISGGTFLDELEERGYDLSTLKFSIDKLPVPDSPEGEKGPVSGDPFYQP